MKGMKVRQLFSTSIAMDVNLPDIVNHQTKALMDECENAIGGVDRQMRLITSKLKLIDGLAEGLERERLELALESLTAICEDALIVIDVIEAKKKDKP